MTNKDKSFFLYNSGDLVCLISLLTSQSCTRSRKVMIKYVVPIVIYKIIHPQLIINDIGWKNFMRVI